MSFVGSGWKLAPHRRTAYYLLYDDFLTPDAAPLGSPRTCEPGPGTLTVTETNGGRYEIVDSELRLETAPSAEFVGVVGGGLTRAAGLAVLAVWQFTSTPLVWTVVGWKENTTPYASGVTDGQCLVYNGVVYSALGGGAAKMLKTLTPGTAYKLALILRSVGCFVCIKHGADWVLEWVGNSDTRSTVYPMVASYTSETPGLSRTDVLKVVQLAGPWVDDDNIWTSALDGSVSDETTFEHEADCLIEFIATTIPTSTDFMQLRFRMPDTSDDDNCWRVYTASAGNVTLVEMVGGTYVNRGSAGVGTLTGGERVVTRAYGTTIEVWVGVEEVLSVADATNHQTATGGKVDKSGGVLSDVRAWPYYLRGTKRTALEAV